MVELDFGFLNVLTDDRKGLVYQKFFLDRLAPIFFPLRVTRLLDIRGLDSRVCNMVLPLGPGNLQHLNPDKRQRMLEQSHHLVNDFQLLSLAVDRRLKKDFLQMECPYPIVFGDYFIEVLALVQTRRAIARYNVKKIVIVGESEHFPLFVEALAGFGLPVSIQSPHPTRYEVLAYRLLYEKGLAVTTSIFKPPHWEKGDLVVGLVPFQNGTAYPVWRLNLDDESRGWAPELDAELQRSGLDSGLHHLAPLLESTLLAKAGYFQSDEEASKLRMKEIKLAFLEELGSQMGIWDQFLDKAL